MGLEFRRSRWGERLEKARSPILAAIPRAPCSRLGKNMASPGCWGPRRPRRVACPWARRFVRPRSRPCDRSLPPFAASVPDRKLTLVVYPTADEQRRASSQGEAFLPAVPLHGSANWRRAEAPVVEVRADARWTPELYRDGIHRMREGTLSSRRSSPAAWSEWWFLVLRSWFFC